MSWGRTVLVVTGASRGFGAMICQRFSPKLGPGSVILALARSKQLLEDVGRQVQEINQDVKFIPVTMDLGLLDVATLRFALDDAFAHLGGEVCQTAMLVHNAGSLGTLHAVADLHDFEDTKRYFDFNVSSVFPINAAFLERTRALKETSPDMKVKVVNVSSLIALQPFPSFGLYATGKAARDMAMKVLALEDPSITVLNYAPGAMDTEMLVVARKEVSDAETRQSIITMHSERKLLTPQVSVDQLIFVLERGSFASGDHVDYYDK